MLREEKRPCRDDELFVELSQGPKGDKKSNFAFTAILCKLKLLVT